LCRVGQELSGLADTRLLAGVTMGIQKLSALKSAAGAVSLLPKGRDLSTPRITKRDSHRI